MKVCLKLLLCLRMLQCLEAMALESRKEPSNCGDWTPYKDSKCIKIAAKAGPQTQEDGEIVCDSFSEELHRESYPKLITIKSKEEQDFLQKLLFVENHIEFHVWLGLTKVKNTGEFVWNDGSTPIFTNWANQTISDDQHNCVQMESGGGAWEAGLWVKVKCRFSNTVVCERTQTLTLERLQNLFFSYKLEQKKRDDEATQKSLETERKLNEAERKLAEAEKTFVEMKQNPVPVGFIYIQLYGQASPSILWPRTNWKNVSASYAGLFFRAEGGGAAPFGQTQEDNTRRLLKVESTQTDAYTNPTIPPDGSLSQYCRTGGITGTNQAMRFKLSIGEIRPRNQAVAIWQKS